MTIRKKYNVIGIMTGTSMDGVDCSFIQTNGTNFANGAPFGGYKQSGNGREGGSWGLEEFLEIKSISGWK